MASSALLTRASTHILKPLISTNQSVLAKPTARLFHATTTTPAIDSGAAKFSDHLRQMYESFDFEKHPYMMAGPEKYCNIKEDDDALYARLDMPGISKEGLKLWVENGSTLFISGDEGKSRTKYLAEEERIYSSNIAVSPEKYRTDQIKAMLKNGVLRIVVPKVKEEEKTDGVNITIE